jgi:hypothetical protein
MLSLSRTCRALNRGRVRVSVLALAGGCEGTLLNFRAVPHAADPLLAKVVAATGGPAAPQVKCAAGWPVNDRESRRRDTGLDGDLALSQNSFLSLSASPLRSRSRW